MACPTHSAIHSVEIVPGTHFFVPLRGAGGERCTAYTAGQNTVTTINQLSKSVVLKKTKTESEILKGERKKKKTKKQQSFPSQLKKLIPNIERQCLGLLHLAFPRQM